jgi:hypothetical protein
MGRLVVFFSTWMMGRGLGRRGFFSLCFLLGAGVVLSWKGGRMEHLFLKALLCREHLFV